MLGGSSAINFFEYHRPAVSDINGKCWVSKLRAVACVLMSNLIAWEKLGNKGWNWDLMKKYYIKHEKFVPPEEITEVMSLDMKEHGTEGTDTSSSTFIICFGPQAHYQSRTAQSRLSSRQM